jgi:hypothetical protein
LLHGLQDLLWDLSLHGQLLHLHLQIQLDILQQSYLRQELQKLIIRQMNHLLLQSRRLKVPHLMLLAYLGVLKHALMADVVAY